MPKKKDKEVGFLTMGDVVSPTSEIPEVGVGMLGYAFMGKAHSHAYKTMSYIYWPPPAIPKLVAISGRREKRVAEAARRFGYEKYYTDWHKMLKDDKVELFDNGAPNDMHMEPCIEAAEAGKPIWCEKPLGRNTEEAKEMVKAANKAGIKNMVSFNARFLPAIGLAKQLIDEGRIGKVYHFRGQYLQEWILPHQQTPLVWRLDGEVAGSGSLGDLAAHTIDLGRYLVGEYKSVMATTKTMIKERTLPDDPKKTGKVTVDDAVEAVVEFKNGAVGTIEASRMCSGRKNHEIIEINGKKGSIYFDMEDMNRLKVNLIEDRKKGVEGFHDVIVTEASHPNFDVWWPHGHIIGWGATFVHEARQIVDAVVNDADIGPQGATFEDGYKCNLICDAMVESAKSGKKVSIKD
jgi:predicted dehydrogenase